MVSVLTISTALWLSWVSIRRYQMTRPPLGVFNLSDIAVMLLGVVLIPYLYLYLPRWLVSGLLLLGAGSILSLLFEPVLRLAWVRWLVILLVLGADLRAAWHASGHQPSFLLINNLVQVLTVVGVTVLWAQSGMKARDATVLGLTLALYDFLFTTQLPLMADLFAHLVDLPFAPLVAWPVGSSDHWLGIGVGDLLMAAIFPLVLRKAFGRSAGWSALGLSSGTIAILFVLPTLSRWTAIFPVMVVLGPLMGLQYAFWRHRCGPERTTWQYWQEECHEIL